MTGRTRSKHCDPTLRYRRLPGTDVSPCGGVQRRDKDGPARLPRYTERLELARGRPMLLAVPRADLSSQVATAIASAHASSCVWNTSTLRGHGGIVPGPNPCRTTLHTAKHTINYHAS